MKSSPHTLIFYKKILGFEPNAVNFDNRDQIFKKLYGVSTPPSECMYKVGDIVRIPLKKNIFTKGYKPSWTKELYEIVKVRKTDKLCYYKIETILGEKIEKFFYKQELNLVIKK